MPDSAFHLLISSLLIGIHKVIIVLLIIIAPTRLGIILQLLLYLAIVGCFASLTTRTFVENVAEVEFFVFKIFVVAFLFRCALELVLVRLQRGGLWAVVC